MKGIFTYNSNMDFTAYLNWRIEKEDPIGNVLNIANGFMMSAISLARTAISDNDDKNADIIIFPILNNANHSIELYLKGLIWTLNEILGNERKIEGGHNIKRLFEIAIARLADHKGKKYANEFKKQSINLTEYISELFTRIQPEGKDNMDFSRYPITKEYSNHFYAEELDNVVVDLENFIARFDNIHKILELTTDYFYYHELLDEWK